MNNVLEFYVKMKDMMSGGLAKLAQSSQKTFAQVQGGIDKTVIKNKELADSFENVSKKAKNSGDGIGSFIKKMGLVAGLTAVGAGAFGFAKDSVGKAMEFGQRKESFKVLVGDDKKGLALTNDLNKLQQDTILGPEVFKAAQTMLGFGIGADKVLPTMRMLGDVSMGDANKLESLTLAFSQIQAAGKLQGQDLLQLINAGFNPLNEISKKTGKSIGELKDMMAEGSISAKMVEDSFKSATGEGGLFHGMMDKLADTPAGQLAQLSGAWESFQIKVGEVLMPLATMAMKFAAPLLDVAGQYLPMISSFISGIFAYFSSLNDASSQWSAYLQIAEEWIGIIWEGASHVFQAVWHILDGVIKWVGHSEILKDVFAFLKNMAFVLWQYIKGIADALVWIWDNVLSPVLNALEGAYKWVKGILGLSDSKDMNVTLTKTVKTDDKSTSLNAAQAAGSKPTDLSSFNSLKGASTDTAKGITSGGPRVINIHIGKMVERIEVHAGSVQEGLQGLEHRVEEIFLRILNSGASVQGN